MIPFCVFRLQRWFDTAGGVCCVLLRCRVMVMRRYRCLTICGTSAYSLKLSSCHMPPSRQPPGCNLLMQLYLVHSDLLPENLVWSVLVLFPQYCDQRVCVCVRLWSYISKTTCQNYAKVTEHVICGRVLVWMMQFLCIYGGYWVFLLSKTNYEGIKQNGKWLSWKLPSRGVDGGSVLWDPAQPCT